MGRSLGGGRLRQSITYSALPSQRKFHRSEARFKGFSGPVGSGKSQALCQEALRLSYLNAGRLGLIGAPTYPMLRDTTQRAFLEALSDNGVPFRLNKAENVLELKDIGSKVVFRSIDQFERLRGTNLAWFGIDELTYAREEAWLRLEGRLRDPKATRLCGFAVWTPKGFDWVYRRFISEQVEGYEAILAQPYENRHLLDKVPDFYDRLKSSYDARFFEQEVLGAYLNVNSGRVYHGFERANNMKPLTITPNLPLLWALDFNVEPMCSIVAQRTGNTIHVLDEIVLSRATTYEACEEFSNRFWRHLSGIVVYGDASGSRMQTSGATDYKIIQDHFRSRGVRNVDYRVPKSNPLVRERVNLVNAKLKPYSGTPSLFADPKCRELAKDFEEVSYKEGTVGIDKTRDLKRTHLSDALGYLVWQECRPEAGIGERNVRLF